MKLQLATDLALPLDAVTEVLAFLGRRGQGKSYAAQRLAELFHAAAAQFVVIDQVGIWWGLRLAADGKAPGIPIPVLGGLHGDIPLEPTAGKVIADLVADRAISVVLDVSQFESDAARNRFIHDFVDRFYVRRKAAPAAVHVFLEECQEDIPQNPTGDGEKGTLHVLQRMVKLGRNYGIGVSLISQRPQEVHKKVLNLAEVLFAFQLSGLHERKAVAGWIQDKAIEEDIEQELPRLERGHPHVWSPAWLKVSRVVAITPRWTFDASSTPKVGVGAKARELGPIDLDDLRKKMAATIERAKAEDPRELRRQLQEAKRALATMQAATPAVAPAPAPRRVEVPVLKAAELARMEKFAGRLTAATDAIVSVGVELGSQVDRLASALKQLRDGGAPHPTSHVILSDIKKFAVSSQTTPRPVVTSHRRHASEPVPGLSRSQQRILNGLAWLESVGIERAEKTQVALLADQSPTSGGYFNNLGVLRTAGLITYPTPGRVALTDAGRGAAESVDVPQTNAKLHRQLFARLSGSQVRILEALIAAYPNEIAKPDLAEQTGQSPTSGGYFNNLGRLRSLGLIGYPTPGRAVALPVLFLERP